MIDIPIKAARAFQEDCAAYFAEPSELKRSEIAARQMHVLNGYLPQCARRLRLSDVKQMFSDLHGMRNGKEIKA